ncbi:carboxylic ester hydrolase [Gemmatimonadetes bacterium T265]|nr:carboxylic ester hydrolase [Gemmatimonadetes bacterium T265]
MSNRTRACAALLACAAAAAPLAAQPAPRVTTADGAVGGTRDSATGVLLFRGVPYAAPPVGPLRFRPPAPAARWTGVRPATTLGHNCLQPHPYDDIDPYAAGVSEDCLYLNVATAGTAGPARPVMVWIHGGGFFAGFGGEERHNPTRLAQKGAVVVTLNYRLGVFGFLAHPALAGEPGGFAGNYGLLDQIAALQWVRRNVARFGGDPARVTIFGESAGGMSVGALVASALAKGLFERAILESGSGIGGVFARRDSALAHGARVAAALGITGDGAAARLRALPVESLLAAGRADSRAHGGEGSPTFWPDVDGRVLPLPVDSALAAGRANLVPSIVGSNRDEPPTIFGAPARSFARLLTARGVPAYVYQFTRAGEDSAARARGAYHSAEITFVFGRPRPILAAAGRAAYDSTLAETMSDYWVAFAATGDPNGALPNASTGARAARPRWPRYDAATDASLELGPEVAPRERVRRAEYDALDAAGRARGEVRP